MSPDFVTLFPFRSSVLETGDFGTSVTGTVTSANLPTVSGTDVLWACVTSDGSTLSVRLATGATEPSDWSSVGVCYSSTGFDLSGGLFGFGTFYQAFNSVSDLTIKSCDTATSSFDKTEVQENFATDGDGYANDTLTYDANGNLTYDGLQAYTYDAWNRLATVAHAYRDSGGTLHSGQVFDTMAYDAAGRRIIKAINGTGAMDCTYHDYYSGQSVVEERNGDNEPIKQIVSGLGYVDDLVQVAMNYDPGTNRVCDRLYWACQDANYNVLGVIDSSGTLMERYEYSAYGQRQVFVSAGSNDPGCYTPASVSQRWMTDTYQQPWGLCEVGHQGLMHDEETGLVYNRARMLNPSLGRFMQEDPLGYVDGPNDYQYVCSHPIDHLDTFGMDELSLQVGLAKYGGHIDVVGTSDLRGLMDGIKAKVGKYDSKGKCDNCIKNILIVGEGTDPNDPSRHNQPVPDPVATGPGDPHDPLKDAQQLGSEPRPAGVLTPETVEFFTELKALACASGIHVTLWSCNTGEGPIGRRVLENIANLVGGDVTGYQNYVSAWGLPITWSGTPHPITISPKK